MKALVYTGVEQLSYIDVEDPKPCDDEVVVEVKAVGICGSDMHAWKGHDQRRNAPLILGHEVAGIIDNNRRVTLNPLVTCMQCNYCLKRQTNLCKQRQIISMLPRQGGFAQFVTIPKRNLIDIPDHITYQQAALAEPIAVAWHALQKAISLSDRLIGDCNLLILGGGAIGLASALVARHLTVQNIWIAETNPSRHEVLLNAGDFNVYNPTATKPNTEFDLIIDAFGNTITQKTATDLICPGGVIISVGLAGGEVGLDVRRMTLEDICFAGSYTYTNEDFINTTDALFAGHLGSLDWFESHSLSEGAHLFDKLNRGKVSIPKVMLEPDE